MGPTIIGVYAPAQGSGKSELARLLVRKTNGRLVTFAETLKEMARVFLASWLGDRFDVERRIWGTDADKAEEVPGLGVTTRHVLQALGTKWGRECVGDDVWVAIAMRKAARSLELGQWVIIDDLRFPNELAAIRAAGGVAVMIRRPGAADTTGHASEGALDGEAFDFEVANDGGLSKLTDEAGRIVVALRKRGRDAA